MIRMLLISCSTCSKINSTPIIFHAWCNSAFSNWWILKVFLFRIVSWIWTLVGKFSLRRSRVALIGVLRKKKCERYIELVKWNKCKIIIRCVVTACVRLIGGIVTYIIDEHVGPHTKRNTVRMKWRREMTMYTIICYDTMQQPKATHPSCPILFCLLFDSVDTCNALFYLPSRGSRMLSLMSQRLLLGRLCDCFLFLWHVSRVETGSCDIVHYVPVLYLWSEWGFGLLRGEGRLSSTVVMQGLACRASVVHVREQSGGLLWGCGTVQWRVIGKS